VHVDGGDVRGDEQLLRVGPVQQREQVLAQRLGAPPARPADAAGSRVRAGDALARTERRTRAGSQDGAGVLVAERRGRRPEQDGMAAAVGLGVGAAGQRRLDADDELARARRGLGALLDADVARRVEDGGPQGWNTTFSACPER
jgi:hypothetical protein